MNTITQSIRRLVRVLCPFLLVFLSFTAVAQTKGITLNLNDVPLKEALEKIEKDYGFVFLYNEKEITLDKNVNCTFRNADIGTVMSKILGADYSFKVKNLRESSLQMPVCRKSVRFPERSRMRMGNLLPGSVYSRRVQPMER